MAMLAGADPPEAKGRAELMAVKFTILGLLVCSSMLGYLVAFALCLLSRRTAGAMACACGSALAAAAFGYRWWRIGHVPLGSIFEVLLCLGMLMGPLAFIWRRFLRVGDLAVDMALAVVVLSPVAFVLRGEPRLLMPALQSPLFVPHVAAYVVAYAILVRAAALAAAQLIEANETGKAHLVSRELATYRMVCLGFPFLTAGLILGAWWGKLAWGDYWNWDPKEMWSLATWLVYVGYLHCRSTLTRRRPKLNAALALTGVAFIIITLLWVNLSRLFAGLHNYA